MVDMDALERQLADESLRIVGPARPVDDLAVYEATAARSQGWGFSMFSALKFVAATAIVALFGGFLLAGILTTPDLDRTAPAAVISSPSPMTTDGLLAGMVTEEVEPGVLRVVNDGVRDLALMTRAYPDAFVDITPAGAVWLSGSDTMYRLGDEATFRVPDISTLYREVAPDGTLWAIVGSGDIQSFDGEAWTERATTTSDDLLLRALAIGPDGTVWVSSGTAVFRLEDDGSLTSFDYADVYDGEIGELVVSPDGDVWTPGGYQQTDVLLRFDGEEWEVIPGPEGFLNVAFGRSLGFGPDGTLWVHASDPSGSDRNLGGLARFDDPGWTVFTEAEGVEPWGAQGWIATDLLTVAPDGSLWLNGTPTEDGCGGVAHWDGTTWTSYLLDSCIHDLAIASDGSVWLRADGGERGVVHPGSVHTYVIRPEAGATTE